MPKEVKLKTLKKRVWHVFSLYIRMRDCKFTTRTLTHGKCFTCDVRLPIGQLQAGHFIAGRHNANLFSEEGCHAQCKTCNILKDGNVLEYRRRIIDMYGDGYDEVLEKEARQIKKFTVDDLLELEKYYKTQIKKLGG